jgi:uncharacterized cofD-like protein
VTLQTAALELELAQMEGELARPNVVAIGGGHGLAAALSAIRTYAGDVTAVVSVADDGGSSGRLTSGLGIPPPGDIRRCLLALSPERSVWSDLFGFRFPGPDDPGSDDLIDVAGHSLGNLIIAALADIAGDFGSAVSWAGRLLGAMGRVVPAADRAVELEADVGGRHVAGQAAICNARGGVRSLRVGPDGVAAHPAAVEAIAAADQIVIGPGSLYTSLLAACLVPGIAEAIEAAPARLVLVMNLVTQDGETLGMTGVDHLRAFEWLKGLHRRGGIVAHGGPLACRAPLDAVTIAAAEAAACGWTVEHADVADHTAPRPVHDPVKLAGALAGLV